MKPPVTRSRVEAMLTLSAPHRVPSSLLSQMKDVSFQLGYARTSLRGALKVGHNKEAQMTGHRTHFLS
jgi:hypothetical protein